MYIAFKIGYTRPILIKDKRLGMKIKYWLMINYLKK